MKKTTVEVSAEEMEVLNKLREQKAQKLKEEEERKAKEAAKATIEIRFKKALETGRAEITQHLKVARDALDAAEKTAEKYGVPFTSSITDMDRSRRYYPASFNKIWGDVSEEILEDYDIYPNSYDTGWEYWSTSSLSC